MLMILLVSWTDEVFAQCANNNSFWEDITPFGVGFTATSTCMYAGEYCTVDVCSGAQYIFSTCGDAGYDTEITLYSSTGTWLGYDDDGCIPESYLVWTATFTGTVYVLLDEYPCLSNATCTYLSCTQNSPCAGGFTICDCDGQELDSSYLDWLGDTYADDGSFGVNFNCATWGYDCGDIPGSPSTDPYGVCFGGLPPANGCIDLSCDVTNVYADYNGCVGIQDFVTLYVEYTGDCYVSSMWYYTTLSGWLELVFDPFTVNAMDPIDLYFNYSLTDYDFYFELSDGSTSVTYTYTTEDCEGGGCANLDSDAVFAGCLDYLGTDEETVDFYFYYDGDCTVQSLYLGISGNVLTYYDLSLDGLTSGDFTGFYLFQDNTLYEYYYVLSDGTTSSSFFYFTGTCAGGCANLDSDGINAGCQDYFGTDEEVAEFYFYYTGDCMVEGIYLGIAGDVLTYNDLSLDGLGNGDFTAFFLFQDNTVYEYYYVLSDGTTSSTFFYATGTCGVTCDDAFFYLAPDCFGVEISWEITDLFGNVIYTAPEGTYTDGFPDGTGLFESALCLSQGCYYFNIYDSYGDGLAGAQYTSCDVDGYYYMTDGSGNILFEISTANYGFGTSHFFCVSENGCSNLDAIATEGICSGGYLPFDIDMYFDGGCTVSEVCISENGNAYTCYDVTGYALESGDGVVYTIGLPDSYYYYYFTLSDGTQSDEFYFLNGSCDEEGYICDCAGTQHTAGVLEWLGDTFADDGSYLWEGQPVDFNCDTWGYDCGDIYTDGFYFDPYGVCSGNLPPGNGCIADETCNQVYFEITTDCYPGETSMALFNEFGDLVYDTGLNALTDEYTTYGVTLCLPDGCYTYAIFDSFGDGLSTLDCIADGDYGIYDGLDFSLIGTGPAAFGDAYYIDFCVGSENGCSDLGLSFEQIPCQSDGTDLYPTFNFTFEYVGDCTVEQVCWSEDGGPYSCDDVTDFAWESGDTGVLLFATPDAFYSFYYILSDGTYSDVFYWLNGNCDNEIVICDCDGTQHTWGVLDWLGDGFADNGFYDWAGQPVNFNCATWGYDCGDIDGAPNLDPYGVCSGGLPPNNGCEIGEEILGCTDPLALNYNPFATINDGSCIYDVFTGCTDADACNYNPDAIDDDGSCEYVTCAGCTDDTAINYDPTATLDDGSCLYEEIEGCTDSDALNYNPLATIDDDSCIFSCEWPDIVYDTYCVPGNTDEFFISVDVNALGNGSPYTLTNSVNDVQVQLNFMGVIELGPFDNDDDVLIQVVSNTLEGCFITSPILTDDCSSGVISGCTDILATNYYADATVDDGSCNYDFQICDCDQQMISPAERFRLGDDDPNTGSGNEPNFNCLAWGYDCGDIDGVPSEDPYNVCDGELPSVLIATETGCPVGVDEMTGLGISIYPNPNNGQFILLNGLNTSEVILRIFDNTGQLAHEGVYYIPQRSSHSFDVSELAQGTYHVSVVSGDYIAHHSLIIQK